MAKVIDKTVLSRKSPKTSALWAYPKDNDNVELRIFNNGEWQNISGTGNSGGDSNSKPSTIISSDVTYSELITMATDAGVNLIDVDTSDNPDQAAQENNTNLKNYFKTQNLFSEEHGSVIDINVDEGLYYIALLHEDGYITSIRYNVTRVLPPHQRYVATYDNRDNINGIADQFLGRGLPSKMAHKATHTFFDTYEGNVYTLYWVSTDSSSREVSKWITFNENLVGDNTQGYTYGYIPRSVTLYSSTFVPIDPQ